MRPRIPLRRLHERDRHETWNLLLEITFPTWSCCINVGHATQVVMCLAIVSCVSSKMVSVGIALCGSCWRSRSLRRATSVQLEPGPTPAGGIKQTDMMHRNRTTVDARNKKITTWTHDEQKNTATTIAEISNSNQTMTCAARPGKTWWHTEEESSYMCHQRCPRKSHNDEHTENGSPQRRSQDARQIGTNGTTTAA